MGELRFDRGHLPALLVGRGGRLVAARAMFLEQAGRPALFGKGGREVVFQRGDSGLGGAFLLEQRQLLLFDELLKADLFAAVRFVQPRAFDVAFVQRHIPLIDRGRQLLMLGAALVEPFFVSACCSATADSSRVAASASLCAAAVRSVWRAASSCRRLSWSRARSESRS